MFNQILVSEDGVGRKAIELNSFRHFNLINNLGVSLHRICVFNLNFNGSELLRRVSEENPVTFVHPLIAERVYLLFFDHKISINL
jgi:hypothetical protein